MNLLFLGGFYSEEIQNWVFENSLCTIDFAADNLQKSILNGFKELGVSFSALCFPFIGSYPKRFKSYKVPFVAFNKEKHGFSGESVGYTNITYYKNFSIKKRAVQWILNWADRVQGTKVILVYSFASVLLEAALQAKRENSELRICLIVPDFTEYMTPLSNPLERVLSKMLHIGTQTEYEKCQEVDGYVLLSKYMVERLPVGNKPWIVMEGIYNEITRGRVVAELSNSE